jgi:hypothetical protein
MARSNLEARLEKLEAEVVDLKRKVDLNAPEAPWWKQIVGIFADDPHFEEAVRLGREYRESLRPKPRARRR